jgi:Domain of unknown function (DUF1707)/Domain of unknown function (DUF4190)
VTASSGHGIPAWSGSGGDGYLRASTADRECAVEVLKTGYAEGRLTKDEYDARAGQAFAARTLADLDAVTADLPGGRPAAPAWPPAAVRTNQLAVGALVCGVGQLFLGPLATIPAIVLGHMARREIRRTGEDGMGLATIGLVLGWAGAALLMLIAFLAVAVIAVAHT